MVEGQYHLCHKSPITNNSTNSRSTKTKSNLETRNKGCAYNVSIVTSGHDSVITNHHRSNFDKESERAHIREDMKKKLQKKGLPKKMLPITEREHTNKISLDLIV